MKTIELDFVLTVHISLPNSHQNVNNLILNLFYFGPSNNILGALGRPKKWFNVTQPGSGQLPICANVMSNGRVGRGCIVWTQREQYCAIEHEYFSAFVGIDFDELSRLNMHLYFGHVG